MHFYACGGALFQEFDPCFQRTRFRVDNQNGDSTFFDTQQQAEQHIYLALDTASPISLVLTINHKPVGRWEQAA